jgi:hypothetical protein
MDSYGEEWYFNAQCAGLMRRSSFLTEGTVNPSALPREVHSRGADALLVTIFHEGALPFETSGGAEYLVKSASNSEVFRIPTDVSRPPLIRQQFGYSQRDLARMSLPLFVLLILPIILTLLVRRNVLRKPDARNSGAWFGTKRSPVQIWAPRPTLPVYSH